jgi:hypothetical protein
MTLTVFSINGYMGQMFAGPQAEVAQWVQQETGIYWQPIGYECNKFPLSGGVASGLAEFENQRNLHPGPYVLSTWSEGACIGTLALQKELDAGNTDCKGGTFYGNPYRAAGQWNPSPPALGAVGDPGGAGVGGPGNNWKTPDTIHHYCHGPNQPSYDGLPGIDQYTCCSTGEDGNIARIFYDFVFTKWTGAIEEIYRFAEQVISDPPIAAWDAFETAIEWIRFFGGQCVPHTDYTSYAGKTYLTTLVKELQAAGM